MPKKQTLDWYRAKTHENTIALETIKDMLGADGVEPVNRLLRRMKMHGDLTKRKSGPATKRQLAALEKARAAKAANKSK